MARPPANAPRLIVTRTPLRVSFAGGGTDLSAFYEHEPGAVVSTAISQYVYVTVTVARQPTFVGGLQARVVPLGAAYATATSVVVSSRVTAAFAAHVLIDQCGSAGSSTGRDSLQSGLVSI